MRSAFLALALLLGLWVPQAVRAHAGHAHDEAPAPVAKAPLAAPPVPAEAASPCAPGAPAHVCGCGNLAVCDGRPDAAVALAVPFLELPGAESGAATCKPKQPSRWPQFSPACPRGPPPSP